MWSPCFGAHRVCSCGAGYNGSKKKALSRLFTDGAAAHRIPVVPLGPKCVGLRVMCRCKVATPSVAAMIAVPQMRCPTCRSIAWRRNGFVIAQDGEGLVDRRRVAPAERSGSVGPAAWSCARCGFAAAVGTPLYRGLAELQVAHLE